MLVEARFERSLPVFDLPVAREGDKPLRLMVLAADEARDLVPVQDRQAEVDEGEIRMQPRGGAHGLRAVSRRVNYVPLVLEQQLEHLSAVVVALDDQHAP